MEQGAAPTLTEAETEDLLQQIDGTDRKIYVAVIDHQDDPAHDVVHEVVGGLGRDGTYVVVAGGDVGVHSTEFDHAIAERYQELANARPREDLPARLSTLVFAIASTPATAAAEDGSSTPWVWIALALVAIAAVAAGATVWALRRGGAHAGDPGRAAVVSAPSRLERYAELAVRVGTNVQPGQTLFLSANVAHAEFAAAIVRQAYRAGAAYVDVRFRDDRVRKALVEEAPDEALTYTPPWLESWAESQDGQATLWVGGDPDPTLLADVDGDRLARARMRELIEISIRHLMNRSVNWSGIALPTAGWAEQVYGEPDVERLWEAVAWCTRLDEDDPVAAWREHMARLQRRAEALDALRLDALRYTGPGTDFTIGLAPNARWTAALYRTASGIEYVPNMPTEEVFTTPDCRRAEGTIASTKPLALGGKVVEGLRLTVRDGRIVEVEAESGADFIRGQLATDERAAYFGEVALVDETSRVGKLDTVFFDGLYDENTSSHIAFGAGIPQVFDGDPGDALNVATVHTDFMVGSPELTIEGVTADGRAVTLLANERWQLPE